MKRLLTDQLNDVYDKYPEHKKIVKNIISEIDKISDETEKKYIYTFRINF
jgi:hypothetical protein